jgi:steroid delta-isomerase-like uncharacterized protein
MSTEANKAKVRRYFEDALSKGDLSAMDDLVAPGEIVHPYPTDLYRGGGPEAAKQFVTAMRDTFGDLQCTVESQIAEGDMVMTRWTARGVHKGELLGVPATGKPVTVTGLIVHRFSDGKSVETWGEWDRLGLLEQFGAFPAEREVGA